MRILGIDPGKSGALAIFNPMVTMASGLRWGLVDMPEQMNDLRDFLRKYSPDYCFLEHVTPMRGWGTVPSFRLGQSLGRIQGVLACCDIQTNLVSPVAWKRFYELLKQDKRASREKAAFLFPEMREHIDMAKHDGRAEAMLIAGYGAHKLGDLL